MKHAAVALVLALAACGDPPPLTIKYELTAGPDQACMDSAMQPARTCSDVAMPCEMYLSVRVVSPDDPTQAFISVCQPVTGQNDLCSIAGIDLKPVAIPEQTLEVEVALYPADKLVDADGDGKKDCPTDPKFAPGGLPVSAIPLDGSPLPAVGGSAYYHPGDTETDVALGCTSQADLGWCESQNTIDITATVKDFDQLGFSITAAEGDQLILSTGEPQPSINPGEYVLNPNTTEDLARTVVGPVPSWGASIDQMFTSAACLEVLEDAPQTTPALTCKAVTPDEHAIDFTGIRLAPATLQQVLSAGGLSSLPMRGLVVGMVVDYTGAPVANRTVTATPPPGTMGTPEIDYLSADRTHVVSGATSTSGIFFSPDAPFGTVFSASGSGMLPAPVGYGGVVDGKVTVVVLQYTKPQGT